MTIQEHAAKPHETGEPEVPSDTSIADTDYLPQEPTTRAPDPDYDPFDVDPEDVDDK